MAEDILAIAHEYYNTAKEAWSDIYENIRQDLEFLSDEPYAQWDKKLLDDRKSRPVYQVDQLSQFIHQVENDIRMNTPSIDIIPDDEATDAESAEILQGIIRGIEYKSNADAAYDNASSFSIRCSLGFIRVDNVYVNDESFEQELRIRRCINPTAVYIDPNSVEPDGSDAMYGFELGEISCKEFEIKYPKANPISFGEKEVRQDNNRNKVTIAEFFRIVEETEEIGLTENGEVQKVDKNGEYKAVRKKSKKRVERYLLSGQDVLEKTSFPGKHVPIVPVYGEEAWRDGKRYLFSLIRKAKSSQQMFNLGVSLDVEMLMKQPQASFMAAAGQISGFEHEYADPTKANVLHYNQTDVNGQAAPAPQRVAPPQSPIGFINMSREAVDNIKSTLGMYNASIGQRSNETSGKAINARKLEADVANYHFSDNLVRSITQVGKILVCAFPDIYDTPRAVKMVDKEENTKLIGINGYRVEGQERDFDFRQGQYDVRVTTGASFTTQRQEAAANYSQLIQAMPNLMPVIGDLVFKYQDTAGSQAIAERLKKLVAKTNPDFLDEEDIPEEENPQVAALKAQIQALQAEAQATIAQLQAELQNKQADIQSKQVDAQIKAKELEIKQNDQLLKAQELQNKMTLEAEKLAIEKQKVEIDAYNAQKDTPQQSTPTAIKLDTTGFQFAKTPEQEAMDAEKMLEEEQEYQLKLAQTQAVIDALNGIQTQLAGLTQTTAMSAQQTAELTQAVTKPIEVIRDEQGNIIGAV